MASSGPDSEMIPLAPQADAPPSAARTAVQPPSTQSQRRECRRCGYDLAGLGVSGRCPECAFPIQPPRGNATSDQLAEAPALWLRVLLTGTTALLIGSWAGIGGALVFAATGHWALLLVMFGAAGCWGVGVWLVTRQRPTGVRRIQTPELEWLWSRRMARWTQPAWIVTVACEAGLLAPGLAPTAIWLGWVSLGVALLGTPAVFVQLSRLALWAFDDDLAGRLRYCTVLGPVGVLIAVGIASGLSIPAVLASWWPFRTVALTSLLSLLIPLLFTLGQMWYVRSMASWALIYHLRSDDRIDRDRERADRLLAVAQAQRVTKGEVSKSAPIGPGPAAAPSRNSRAADRT